MAAKKKGKSKKAKSPVKSKKSKAKKPAAKTKVKKKVARKKAVARKPTAKKAAPKMKPMAKPAMAPKPAPIAAPVTPPGEERVGIVTHYYNHLSVAIIMLETGTLRSGETVHIKGHTSDFRQVVGSMEVNHVHVDTVQAGTSFGLRVNEHAREHDVVYRASKM